MNNTNTLIAVKYLSLDLLFKAPKPRQGSLYDGGFYAQIREGIST